MHIAVMIGTRPEAIKMAPVVKALQEDSRHRVSLCTTGQHREMLLQALGDFDLQVTVSLDVMTHNQGLAGLTSRLIKGCDSLLEDLKPDWVLVQGDTSTVMAASLAAFYRDIRVGHVEAGLRSFEKRSPFPEEMNRKVTGVLADMHFAPTEGARRNLLAEGVLPGNILVTGNTVIDALLWTRERVRDNADLLHPKVREALADGKRILLVTCHRRESFGAPLGRILSALLKIAECYPECLLVYPVHLNPNVQDAVRVVLAEKSNVLLLNPLSYRPFVALLDVCDIVISDSGGLQEEAPALDKPVLVLRDVTERPEGVEAGVARLVGTDPELIVTEVRRLLTDQSAYDAMAKPANPYGDGRAAERIRKALYE